MLNDYACRRLFEEFIADTNDGFIVVDPNGIVLEINQNYCDFLGKTQEEIVGRPIQETISTTTMHEVLRSRQRGDGPNGVYLHPYAGGDTRLHVDTHAVCNRFCFFAGDGALLGAAAQISFKERTAAMAYGLMEQELQYYKEAYQNQSAPAMGLKQIIGNSPKMEELKRKTQKIARRDFPVLITGETGTGKEMFAKAIHLESARRDKPIISINCAAIPAELLESELFG